MLKGLSWYWSRLTCMSPSEILFRIRKTTYMQTQRLGFLTVKDVPPADLSVNTNNFIHLPNDLDIESYVQAAERVKAGNIAIFALDNANLSETPCWNKDPLSGTVAPLSFGKTLNYRNNDIVGDIKYLWEPNRHLQLVTLAQAYYLTQDKKHLDVLQLQLTSWFDQCPYLKGPNWTSSLELGIRLINWSIIWQLIGGKDSLLFAGQQGEIFRQRWLDSIYQHTDFISGHLSGYSSSNNHLIGEVAGLYVASHTWPYWNTRSKWRQLSQKILEREALKQNAGDGVNLEQAISYQQFVLDFLLISALAGRANGETFSPEYWQRIEKMLEYTAAIMDCNGNIPMIGDADDGYVVKLSQETVWCPYKSLLATGSVLFERNDFITKAGIFDDKTQWLLGDCTKDTTEKTAPLNFPRKFDEGGYYVLGADLDTENEIKIVVDAGPLGYQSIAAHGHADALSFTLNIAGLEFLIDPGTYAYHTQKKWRDYFRGTTAHNTACVDGLDQSVSGGNFMWLRKAAARCEVWQSNSEIDQFIGSHDGYTRLEDGVIHQREISLHKAQRKIMVTDNFVCKEKHTVELFWHFCESCDVRIEGSEIRAINGEKELSLTSAQTEAEPQLIEGDENRPLGWVSRRYDIKVSTQVATWRTEIKGNSSFVTVIQCS